MHHIIIDREARLIAAPEGVAGEVGSVETLFDIGLFIGVLINAQSEADPLMSEKLDKSRDDLVHHRLIILLMRDIHIERICITPAGDPVV